jgi:hypothetical protein
LKEGYEWCRPYYQDPEIITTEDISLIEKAAKDNLVTTGETSFVADCIYAEWPFFISPSPNNVEQMVNAKICNHRKIATNLGRQSNISLLKEAVEKVCQPKLKMQENRTLDQIIYGKENSF